MPDSMFFSDEFFTTASISNQVSQLRAAQEICDQCPVIRECLTHALSKPEEYGIWAGTSGNMRDKMLKRIANQGLDIGMEVEKFLEIA